jgi:hypothetical protein
MFEASFLGLRAVMAAALAQHQGCTIVWLLMWTWYMLTVQSLATCTWAHWTHALSQIAYLYNYVLSWPQALVNWAQRHCLMCTHSVTVRSLVPHQVRWHAGDVHYRLHSRVLLELRLQSSRRKKMHIPNYERRDAGADRARCAHSAATISVTGACWVVQHVQPANWLLSPSLRCTTDWMVAHVARSKACLLLI